MVAPAEAQLNTQHILIRGKNKVFAVGPEVQLALAKNSTLYGFLKVNYQWEVYARTTTHRAVR